VGAALALVAIFVLSLVPAEDRPHTHAPGGLEHVAAYMVAGFLLGLAGYGRLPAIRVVLVLTACGALLELAQLWVPGRNGQLVDIVADFAGCIDRGADGRGVGAPYSKHCGGEALSRLAARSTQVANAAASQLFLKNVDSGENFGNPNSVPA
jgi:hypothetical protein